MRTPSGAEQRDTSSAAWAAFLHGVNVGGVTVRARDLVDLLEGLGLRRVRTVLASGNAVFEAGRDREALAGEIASALRDRFGYEARVTLVTATELEALVAGFPFDATAQGRQPYAVLCADQDTADRLAEAGSGLDGEADPTAQGERAVYWHPARGASTATAFAKLLASAGFRRAVTTRNLRTLTRVLAAMG